MVPKKFELVPSAPKVSVAVPAALALLVMMLLTVAKLEPALLLIVPDSEPMVWLKPCRSRVALMYAAVPAFRDKAVVTGKAPVLPICSRPE